MNITRLYPLPSDQVLAKGLYLEELLPTSGGEGRPFVYANFLASLDGRIAIKHPNEGSIVPQSLTSALDFRLFQELQAHADCLITHSAYLRALKSGTLGNILQVGQDTDTQYLADWRKAQSLKPQPDLVIASSSLNFEIPDSLAAHEQKVMIATGSKTSPSTIDSWSRQGYEVLRAGKDKEVEGAPLIKTLADRGYRRIYLIAGPRMLETMVAQRQLSRLYLTTSHQLLGSHRFHTVIPGVDLGQPANLRLRSLYYAANSGPGESYAMFEPAD